MESDLEQVIKATQKSLGKYIKRPPLTDKLLRKPPFRFLHDITTSVLTTTGFFSGLFDDDELISDNVKDKELKIAFLNKIIYVVGKTTGKQLHVKPSKIVAGQEPEKTNQLLQCIADALDRNLTSDEAVKKLKDTSNGKSIETSDKVKLDQKTVLAKNKEKIKNVQNKSSNKESPPKLSKQNSKLTTKKDKKDNSVKVNKINKHSEEGVNKNNITIKENVKTKQQHNDSHTDLQLNDTQDVYSNLVDSKSITSESTSSKKFDEEVNITPQVEIDILSTNEEDHTLNVIDKNEDSINIEKPTNTLEPTADVAKTSDNNKIGDELHPDKDNSESLEVSQKTISIDNHARKTDDQYVKSQSVRPSSSRPGAPRIRDKQDSNNASKDAVVLGKVNLISENILPEEEDESFLIVETQEGYDRVNESIEQVLNNEHGHLVQQILKSQKDFTKLTGSTEIEWQFGIQKARDDIFKDIELLRFSIQAISRVANPLGKLLDHIQEDVEVMRQELIQWTKTYEETSQELSKQKALNEESLLPLYAKIKQLDADTAEKQEKINDGKIIFHKNNLKIERLLANGSVQYEKY